MTRVGLSVRETSRLELMDDPDCDLTALRQTYRYFRVLNRVVAGWQGLYRRRIRPLLDEESTTTLLDIGSGGGDVPRALARWAAADRLRLEITAVDPDERAHEFASSRPGVPGVTFRSATSRDLVAEGAQFDLVTSNHLLHHLGADELTALLGDSERLARQLVLHNDLERSRLAFGAFAVASRPLHRRSFVHADGLLSIRRSYRAHELQAEVPDGWRVERLFPSRLLLVRQGHRGGPTPSAPGAAQPERSPRSGTIET